MDENKFAGIIIGLTAAIIWGFGAVFNRSLKAVPTPVILFYHALLGFFMIWIYIGIEAAITGELRLTEYSAKVWAMGYGAAVPDSFYTALATLAYQKDRSGMVALMTYMMIVYSFICDYLVF